MKINKIAVLIIIVLLGSFIFIYGNVRNIKTENHQLKDGLDAIENAVSKGKDSNSKNDSQSISEANTDMQEGTSDNTIGTPDDFPTEYNFGSGKIADFSRTDMLKKMPKPSKNNEDPFYTQFEEQYDVLKNMGIQTKRIVLEGWSHGFGSDGGWIKQYAEWLEEIFKQE